MFLNQIIDCQRICDIPLTIGYLKSFKKKGPGISGAFKVIMGFPLNLNIRLR